MSRFSILKQRPRRTLAVLTAVLAALGVVVASGANFSAQTANPSNTFTAGTLTMSNSKDAAAIFTPSNMKPGGAAQTGEVDIANTGSLAGTFTLSRTDLVDTDTGTAATPDISSKINLVVKDCGEFTPAAPTCEGGDPVEYTGTLAGFNSAVTLESFAPGEKHKYQFAADLDASAGNEYQGDSSSARFQWDAAQD